ncbi:MAG: PAS domain S-box protein [Desulfobacter sp.]|nr:MAG: PAS domain S-box protein [Desulfobacter sp.]
MELGLEMDIRGKGARPWLLRISPLWEKNGRQSGWLIVLRDTSHQKAAENALRHARNYVKSIINSMPCVIIGVDREARVIQWNSGASEMTGIREKEARGKPLNSLFPQVSSYLPDLKRAVETGQTQLREKQVLTLDAKSFITYILIFPVLSKTTPGAVIRVDDISEKTRLEQMMVQSEKMMSVGGLAAGMAHEINNPLSGMIQNVQVIYNRLSRPIPANIEAADKCGIDLAALTGYMEDRKIFYMLDQVVDVGKRAAKIVENMLSFSRKQGSPMSRHSLPEMVDATISLLENDFNIQDNYDFRSVAIHREFEGNPPLVPCEKSKIQQVLFNILKNGAQAMAADHTDAPLLRIRYFLDRGSAGVEIQDNGPGIPESVRKRIFEPFFTTKPVGTGTGLGLSVSYFIIKENHRGDLFVRSDPGQGASFTIRLTLNEPETGLPDPL